MHRTPDIKVLLKSVALGLVVDNLSSVILSTLALLPMRIALLRSQGPQPVERARVMDHIHGSLPLHSSLFVLGCLGTLFGAFAAGALAGGHWRRAALWFALFSGGFGLLVKGLQSSAWSMWSVVGLLVLWPLSWLGSRLGRRFHYGVRGSW